MMLRNLFEVSHDCDYGPEIEKRFSNATITRTMRLVFSIDEIKFYILNDQKAIYGCVNDLSEPSHPNRLIFRLLFKDVPTIENYPEGIEQDRILQINSVFLDTAFRGNKIIIRVYEKLVSIGYILVNDEAEYVPSLHLWHSAIRRKNFKVYMMDTNYGFISDKNGPIAYNGTNIKFDKILIWTTGEDYSGCYKLLVMK